MPATGAMPAAEAPGARRRRAGDKPEAVAASGRPQPVFRLHPVPPPLTTLPITSEAGASAKALLSEILAAAERLVGAGEAASIDLRILQSMPQERAILADLLGDGEVSAVVAAIGRSEVRETAVPCVWWIRHLDGDDELLGETIEIADIPELLLGDRDAAIIAVEALRAAASRISPLPHTPER